MKIAIIVSSNIVKDPRVVKQAEIVKNIADDYIVIGRKDENVTRNRLKKIDFKYKLIEGNLKGGFVSKLLDRMIFGFKIAKELRKFNPTIIHANDFDMLFFAYFFKKSNQKLIYDAHEIYAHNGIFSKNNVFSKIIIILEKTFLKKVDEFITVSNAAKDYYIKMEYPITPKVITNAPISNQSEMAPTKSEKFQVLYQGIISEGRGYLEFAQAAEYLKDYEEIQLIIRGYGPLKSEIEEFIKINNLTNICLEQPVEMSEMIYEAKRSHVGMVLTQPISLNFKYTVSNKLFEYIHADLPVILSNVNEHRLLNKKYDIGIVLQNINPESISQAIIDLYLDNDKYNEKKKNILNAKKNLNWEVEGSKLLEVYYGNK